MRKLSYVFYLVLAVVFISCNSDTKKERCGKWIVRNGTSEWNYGKINDVDSLTFKSTNHVTIYINGTKQEIHSKWIQVGRLPNCR